MNLSLWSIRNPVPTIALFLVLCIVGLVSFRQLPITIMPNVDFPLITVDISQRGAAATELMNQVSKPIEDHLSSIAGVDHLASTTRGSHSQTIIQFSLDTSPSQALSDVKDAMTSVRDQLPDSISEPLVQRMDMSGGAIMDFAVRDPSLSIEALSFFTEDVIASALRRAKGVGRVSVTGIAERKIQVELDPARLLAYGVTASDISSQLLTTQATMSAGRASLEGQEMSIRTIGTAESIEQLENSPFSLADGRTLRLSDVGRVIDGANDTREFALLNGADVISIAVFRSTGASELSMADSVTIKVDELRAQYPSLELTLISDTSGQTKDSYTASMLTLYEGAILAIIVVFAFLRNWRATLVTALTLPMSIIPTFFVMQALGFSLNTVSLLGITLVTGILVDDAIVEIENIARHLKTGKSAYQASKDASAEIGLTVVAISLTIVAVFAPVSFMGGIIGQYFRQFGLTVAVAVLFSLLVARTITPMLAAYFIRSQPSEAQSDNGVLMQYYLSTLRWTLDHRTITVVAGAAIFAASLYSATLLPAGFVPTTDVGRSTITLELPPGSTIENTKAVAQQVSDRVLQHPAVSNVHVVGGSDDVSKAEFVVHYVAKSDRTSDSFALEKILRKRLQSIPDIKLRVMGPDGNHPISINVLGNSLSDAQAAAELLVADMKDLPEINNVEMQSTYSKPEIRVIPRASLAAELGVTAASIATTLRVATLGDGDDYLAKHSVDNRQLPIVVRLRASAQNNINQLANLRVPSNAGRAVPLGSVADLVLSDGPGNIERYDKQFHVEVTADLADGEVLGPALAAIDATDTVMHMPEGTSVQADGDAEVMGEMFTSFGLAMGLGILLVYVILVILFGSFITPITILLSLPLCIGGAIFALYLSGHAIGLSVVIGFLMLIGIVSKNAIMLVEFAQQGIKQGQNAQQAALDAGRMRARPIVMTTVAMVAGMVPSALSIGEGSEFRSPMATAVIGGLLLSTLLSLIFVPSLFSVFNSLKRRIGPAMSTLLKLNKADPEEA